jgi:predicted nuclease with TOPRIM domain
MNKIHLSMSLRKANEKLGEQKLEIAELKAKSEVLKYANEGLGFEIIELEKENASLDYQNKRVCTEVAELEKELKVTPKLQGVLDFLLGIGDIEGYDFSEGPEDKGPYWWRAHLREALKEQGK